MDQWDRTENLEVNPDLLQPTEHPENSQEHSLEKGQLDRTDRRNGSSLTFSTHKSQVKWAKDLNVRAEAIKLR